MELGSLSLPEGVNEDDGGFLGYEFTGMVWWVSDDVMAMAMVMVMGMVMTMTMTMKMTGGRWMVLFGYPDDVFG